jgi:hypothetical protein
MLDGHMVLPSKVIKQLKANRETKWRVIIFNEKVPRKDLNQFCGRWKDDRDADEILKEIYAGRDKNCRSEESYFLQKRY